MALDKTKAPPCGAPADAIDDLPRPHQHPTLTSQQWDQLRQQPGPPADGADREHRDRAPRLQVSGTLDLPLDDGGLGQPRDLRQLTEERGLARGGLDEHGRQPDSGRSERQPGIAVPAAQVDQVTLRPRRDQSGPLERLSEMPLDERCRLGDRGQTEPFVLGEDAAGVPCQGRGAIGRQLDGALAGPAQDRGGEVEVARPQATSWRSGSA